MISSEGSLAHSRPKGIEWLHSNGNLTVNGGAATTNDSSVVNPGGMGGQPGGRTEPPAGLAPAFSLKITKNTA